MRNLRKLIGLSLTLLLAGIHGLSIAEPVTAEWALNWQDDLRYLARELPNAHPHAFHTLSEDEFQQEIDALIGRLPTMSHDAIVAELTRIVARLRDGHTRVTLPLNEKSGFFLGHARTPAPNIPGLEFRPLPVRLKIARDGVIIYAADRAHSDIVGKTVSAIAGMPIAKVIESVTPYVHRDNGYQLQYQLPDYLVLPEFLAAAGVIDEATDVRFSLRDDRGHESTVTLSSGKSDTSPDFVDVNRVLGGEVPLYARNTDQPFWMEFLPDTKTLYWQYNEVGDSENETLTEFGKRMFRSVANEDVERLIIDLRRNRGGNNGKNLPLIHDLLRTAALLEPGSVFVLTGGGTFSAAMMFSVDLEKNLPVIFVGEPTGSSPNHYGDSRRYRLPRSGVTVRISSLYWQYSSPFDRRDSIEPHIRAPFSVADYRTGRDPALDAILVHENNRQIEAGDWTGVVSFRGNYDINLRLEQSTGSWRGTVDAPDLGVEQYRVADLAVEGSNASFGLTAGDRHFVFSGKVNGGRLFGSFKDGYRELPVVLERTPPALR